MAKKLHYNEGPSEKELKVSKPFLSEDEELVISTGYGDAYLKSRAIYFIMWPGILVMLATTGYAWYKYQDPQMLGYGLLAGMLGAILLGILLTVRMHHGHRYLLTTRRVIVKRGIFAVKLTSALYDKITHIEVDQSFTDKLLMHHGTIIINTAGASNDAVVLHYVDYPVEFKNILERLINKERQEMNRSNATPLMEVTGELVR